MDYHILLFPQHNKAKRRKMLAAIGFSLLLIAVCCFVFMGDAGRARAIACYESLPPYMLRHQLSQLLPEGVCFDEVDGLVFCELENDRFTLCCSFDDGGRMKRKALRKSWRDNEPAWKKWVSSILEPRVIREWPSQDSDVR